MSGDGAHLGVTGGRALATILGGEEAPKVEPNPRLRWEQVNERIRAMPAPMAGPLAPDADGDPYSYACDAIAHAFLLCADDNPALPLTVDALWDAATVRWPGFDDWLGGATGFMVGWAANCVRFLRDEPPAPNPALVTVLP